MILPTVTWVSGDLALGFPATDLCDLGYPNHKKRADNQLDARPVTILTTNYNLLTPYPPG